MPQQTRRWDEESGTTIYMRSKVDAIDYNILLSLIFLNLKFLKSG